MICFIGYVVRHTAVDHIVMLCIKETNSVSIAEQMTLGYGLKKAFHMLQDDKILLEGDSNTMVKWINRKESAHHLGTNLSNFACLASYFLRSKLGS